MKTKNLEEFLKEHGVFEELLREIKNTLDTTEYVVVVHVPHKKLWEGLCDVLQSTGFASFSATWTTVKNAYWEEYEKETTICFRKHGCGNVLLSYCYLSYFNFNKEKEYKLLNIHKTPKCLRRL